MSPTIDWERLARVELHPVRLSIIELFELDGGRSLSPSEVAYEMRLPLRNVLYHVNALVAAGVLVPVAKWRCRGSTERFYCLEGDTGADLFCRAPFQTDAAATPSLSTPEKSSSTNLLGKK